MENVKLNFVHVCDYAFFGEADKVNILGIFKKINVIKLPAIHPQMYIVTNITVDKGKEYKGIIKLVGEEDEVEVIKPLQFSISSPTAGSGKNKAELAFIGQINNVKFENEGKYLFRIYVNETLIDEVSLEVKKN